MRCDTCTGASGIGGTIQFPWCPTTCRVAEWLLTTFKDCGTMFKLSVSEIHLELSNRRQNRGEKNSQKWLVISTVVK
jgi:hypothetical protein